MTLTITYIYLNALCHLLCALHRCHLRGNHCPELCVYYSFTCFWMLQKWYCTIYSFLGFSFFTQHFATDSSGCCVYLYFHSLQVHIPWWEWTIMYWSILLLLSFLCFHLGAIKNRNTTNTLPVIFIAPGRLLAGNLATITLTPLPTRVIDGLP